MAPTVPRPTERSEEGPGDGTETTAVVVPERPAEPAPPAAKAKPKRPRPKPAAEAPESEAEPEAEPVADPTEQLAVVPAEKALENSAEKTPEKTAGKQPRPASKTRRKPARPSVAAAEATAPGRGARLAALARRHAVPLLAAAAVVLATVAVVAGIQDAHLRGSPAAQNTALVDVGTTAEVSGQLSDAIETVYSFDFARLDENENAARDVITPEFAADFDRLFGEVKARAPQQQAVVTATVTRTAVKEITGDRAVLVAFVDQQATRAAPDAQSQQLAAAGRLAVTGERVDGRWKIAAVTPL